MAKLKNVGAYPNTEDALGRVDYMNARFAASGVTSGDVTAATDAAKSPLVTKSYVDTQDALYVAKTYVDTQDNLLTNANQLGASSGLAVLNSSGKIAAPSPLPRAAAALCYTLDYTTVRSFSSASVTCTSITVPDPGFNWIPLWFGWTEGAYTGTPYCFPGVSIRDSSDKWVARGYGTARNLNEKYTIPVVPTRYDTSPASYYSGSEQFTLYYTREYGTGSVSVGNSVSYFKCFVIPAATSSTSPSLIT